MKMGFFLKKETTMVEKTTKQKMKTKKQTNKNLAILFIALGFAVILSFVFDNLIVQNISKLRNVFLDDVFSGITFISSEIIIFFFSKKETHFHSKISLVLFKN